MMNRFISKASTSTAPLSPNSWSAHQRKSDIAVNNFYEKTNCNTENISAALHVVGGDRSVLSYETEVLCFVIACSYGCSCHASSQQQTLTTRRLGALDRHSRGGSQAV